MEGGERKAKFLSTPPVLTSPTIPPTPTVNNNNNNNKTLFHLSIKKKKEIHYQNVKENDMIL